MNSFTIYIFGIITGMIITYTIWCFSMEARTKRKFANPKQDEGEGKK